MDKVDLMSWALFPRAIGKRQLWLATASLLAFAANPAAAQDAAKGQVARPPAVPTLPNDPVPPGEPDLQTPVVPPLRSEEHTSELRSLMRISYAVFCLKKKNNTKHHTTH